MTPAPKSDGAELPLPVLGVGLGFRPSFRGDLFFDPSQVDFLEITAEHYLDVPREKWEELEPLAEHFASYLTA